MLDNFSEIILKNTNKIVDEKILSTLEKQMATLTNSCQEIHQQGYPFDKGRRTMLHREFHQYIWPNGIYR